MTVPDPSTGNRLDDDTGAGETAEFVRTGNAHRQPDESSVSSESSFTANSWRPTAASHVAGGDDASNRRVNHVGVPDSLVGDRAWLSPDDESDRIADSTVGAASTLAAADVTCRSCGLRSHVVRPCDSQHDTRCECDRGYFLQQADVDNGDHDGSAGHAGICRSCDLCPHGWGASRSCTPLRNSACRRCPTGTYSSVLSSTLACFPCAACEPHQTALQPCTLIQNTVCVDADDVRAKQNKMAVGTKVHSTHHTSTASGGSSNNILTYAQDSDTDHSVWPIYCALFGALILALLAYVVLKRFRFKAPRSQHGDSKRRQPMLANQQPLNAGNHDGAVHPGMFGGHFLQLCVAKRQNLEALLNVQRNDERDWRGLSRELGFKSGKFACPDSKVPIRKLEYNYAGVVLNEWAKNKNAKLHVLVAALHKLERYDIIELLCHEHTAWTDGLVRPTALLTSKPLPPVTSLDRKEQCNNSVVHPSALILPVHNYNRQRALGDMV